MNWIYINEQLVCLETGTRVRVANIKDKEGYRVAIFTESAPSSGIDIFRGTFEACEQKFKNIMSLVEPKVM